MYCILFHFTAAGTNLYVLVPVPVRTRTGGARIPPNTRYQPPPVGSNTNTAPVQAAASLSLSNAFINRQYLYDVALDYSLLKPMY